MQEFNFKKNPRHQCDHKTLFLKPVHNFLHTKNKKEYKNHEFLDTYVHVYQKNFPKKMYQLVYLFRRPSLPLP